MDDSVIVTIVAFSSAPVASRVIPPDGSVAAFPSASNPPETRSQSGLCAVRSGEIANGATPFFTDLKSLSAPLYKTFGSCCERMNGVFQFQRNATFGSAMSRFIFARMSVTCFSWSAVSALVPSPLIAWICAPYVCIVTVRGRMLATSPVARLRRAMLPPCDS